MAQATLTEKQAQVYDLMKKDTDPKEIANKLSVSKAAIYSHIRAIRDAGHPISAKYANVGVGGRGASTRARAKGSGKGRGSAAKRAAAESPPEVAPPTPPRGVGAALAEKSTAINVDDVFRHLREQVANDSARIEARRGEIETQVESLNKQIATLTDEDASLEVALARLKGTDQSIDAEPDMEAARGNGAASVPPVL